jgi:hypothetical protein
MATTYFLPTSPSPATAFFRPVVQGIYDAGHELKINIVLGLHHTADFASKWICCDGVDDESVVENVRRVITSNGCLAEEFVEFTHSPKQQHRTIRPNAVDVFENELPSTQQQQPANDNENGHPVAVDEAPTVVVEVVIPLDAEPVDAIVVRPRGQLAIVAPVQPPNQPIVAEELVVPSASLVFTTCQDVVEVKNHRRVATKGRGFYQAAVVGEIKNKLGLPKLTEANKLVVRRMAHNIMTRHGVRPTHIRMSIEKIVAGVFIPDQYDVESAEMLASDAVRDLRERVNNAGPRNGWSEVVDMFRFGFRRSNTSRVPPVTEAP